MPGCGCVDGLDKTMNEYKFHIPRVLCMAAIAVVLVAIGIVIGVNISKKDEKKPVFIAKQETQWVLPTSVEGQMIYDNYWRFARASYVLIGEIPNCEFYKIVSEVPRNDYDVESYYIEEQEDGFMFYHSQDGERVSTLAVDVSAFQPELDWNALRSAGVTIAMVRVGFRGYGEAGKLVEDDMFRQHIEGAKAAGIKVGVYFFSQALSYEEGVEEAKFAMELTKEYNLEMPIAIDTEEMYAEGARTEGLDVEARTDSIVGFCETVKQAGKIPMIYSNRNWFVQRLDMSRLGEYKLWLAQYANQPDFPYWYQGWQYTDTGSVPGIPADLDLNVWFSE